jgi:ribonucleoside-diphosphate reductase beta chain
MSPRSILTHPPMVYKLAEGFEYPEFFEYYKKAVASVWRPEEVAMGADVTDWQHNLTESERELIAGVLRGFTVMEMGVSEYWGDVVCRKFPKPEVLAMARAFSFFEQIHAQAYNHLSDTLGINEFEAFLSDPAAQRKVEKFFTECSSEKVSLAVFSGAGEGVSLFSSFAMLLAFNKTGRMKGLAQIISWSVSDEQKHSDGGCDLFKQLVKEVGITDEETSEIRSGFSAVIENEFNFLDNIFDKVDNSAIPIALADLKAYIKLRANNRLAALGLDLTVPMTDEERVLAANISSWFDPMVRGQTNSDFFAQAKDGSAYIAKPSQDWMSVDLSSLDLALV